MYVNMDPKPPTMHGPATAYSMSTFPAPASTKTAAHKITARPLLPPFCPLAALSNGVATVHSNMCVVGEKLSGPQLHQHGNYDSTMPPPHVAYCPPPAPPHTHTHTACETYLSWIAGAPRVQSEATKNHWRAIDSCTLMVSGLASTPTEYLSECAVGGRRCGGN